MKARFRLASRRYSLPSTLPPYDPITLRFCIDLAVRGGLPPMLEVTRAVADELQVEELIVADELLSRGEALPAALREHFPDARFRHVSHRELKRLSERARAVVRTGECTPYHNVILASGVTF